MLKDALCGKSISTLRSRVASVTTFGRWIKSVSLPEEVSTPLITEYLACRYISELRRGGTPRSRATRFLGSVGFCKGMLVAEVNEVLASARVKGACISRLAGLEPRKENPWTVEQVAFLELRASTRDDHVGNFAEYMCFLTLGRVRWSYGQHCKEEPWIDEGHDFSYLEARLYHHKTAGSAKVGKRLLPVACPVPGVSRHDWAVSWPHHRELQGLCAGVGKPTMPAPVSGRGWSAWLMSSSDVAMWLLEVLGEQGPIGQSQSIGMRSAKATSLSWMCKAHAPGDIQRLAGYHVDPTSKSALEYSRDSQDPVLHFLEGIILAIFSELFLPDSTRAGRWAGCRFLEQALPSSPKGRVRIPWRQICMRFRFLTVNIWASLMTQALRRTMCPRANSVLQIWTSLRMSRRVVGMALSCNPLHQRQPVAMTRKEMGITWRSLDGLSLVGWPEQGCRRTRSSDTESVASTIRWQMLRPPQMTTVSCPTLSAVRS